MLETHGTGRRARQLGEVLAADGLAEVDGITRHQLLIDPRIPYTSHNSLRLPAGAHDGRSTARSDRSRALVSAA